MSCLLCPIKTLMLCLFTCAAYRVTLSIDIMCTRVSCCSDCDEINWFILALILLTSFVVAVAKSHLSASPRNGSKLLLWWGCDCDIPSKEGLVFYKLIADIIVDLQELYTSSMFESSTYNVDMSWVSANGCWLRNCNSQWVIINCLLKAFQWCSRCLRETCVVMIQECLVRYAFRTGWKMTDSPNSLPDEVVVKVIMNIVLQWRLVLIMYSDVEYLMHAVLIIEFYGR